MMNILYVTSEAAPFCKTGGLADVAGSLPQALAKGGDNVGVVLPLYQSVSEKWRDKLHLRSGRISASRGAASTAAFSRSKRTA